MRSTILHPYALCTFPKSEALQHARASHNAQHSKSCTIEEYSSNCISVPNFASLPQSFPKVKVPMHVLCTFTMQPIIKCHRITHIERHQCTKFGVASSKFPGTGGPLSNKAFLFWRVQPASHENGNRKAYRLAQYTCDLQVWDRHCPLFGLQGRQKNKRCKSLIRALHVHTVLQPIQSYSAKYTMTRSTNLPSLVSLAQNFLAPEDPTSKKFSDPGACSLHPQDQQPEKQTGWGSTRMLCKFGIVGVSRLTYKGPDKFLQAFTQRHVPRASRTFEKCKSTRPPGGPIHPENLVPMPRTVSTPESRNLDTQTDRQTENANLYPQHKSPEYKELSNTKAYEFYFVFLRFCPAGRGVRTPPSDLFSW